jgi:hypothetical protein
MEVFMVKFLRPLWAPLILLTLFVCCSPPVWKEDIEQLEKRFKEFKQYSERILAYEKEAIDECKPIIDEIESIRKKIDALDGKDWTKAINEVLELENAYLLETEIIQNINNYEQVAVDINEIDDFFILAEEKAMEIASIYERVLIGDAEAKDQIQTIGEELQAMRTEILQIIETLPETEKEKFQTAIQKLMEENPILEVLDLF